MAAAAARLARPTAAPVCRLVVNRAPACPWSLAWTPLVIAICEAHPGRGHHRPGSTVAR